MRRTLTGLLLLTFLLGSLGAANVASRQPVGNPAAAQVVTPDPTSPSFENERGVLPVYNLDPAIPTFATGQVDDPNAFPESTVRVRNDKGFAQDQNFWLSIRMREQSSGIEILDQADYADYDLIAPGGDATYTIRFPETASSIVFEVDGSTPRAVMLTILQFAVDAGFSTAGLAFDGDRSTEIGMALAEAVVGEYVEELDTSAPCVNAVEAIRRGMAGDPQFTQDVQACLQSPLWTATIDGVLAKLEPQDWFGLGLQGARLTVPGLRELLLGLDAAKFAAQVWGMLEKWKPWEPGALVGTVEFIGFVTGPSADSQIVTRNPTVATSKAEEPDVLDSETLYSLILNSDFPESDLPSGFTSPATVAVPEEELVYGALRGVDVAVRPDDNRIRYLILATDSDAESAYEMGVAESTRQGLAVWIPTGFSHPVVVISGVDSQLAFAVCIIQVANTLVLGISELEAGDQGQAQTNAIDLATTGAVYLERLIANPPTGPLSSTQGDGLEILLEVRPTVGETLDQDTFIATLDVVARRLAALGVVSATIQAQGTNQILVYVLAGVDDPERVIRVLSRTSLLEIIDTDGQFLPPGTIVDTTLGIASGEQTAGAAYTTIVSSSDVRDAFLSTGNLGESVVIVELSDTAADLLYDFTSGHIGRPMAILIDKAVISSPQVNDAISDTFQITVHPEEAEDLAIQLKAGALPVPLVVVQSRTIP